MYKTRPLVVHTYSCGTGRRSLCGWILGSDGDIAAHVYYLVGCKRCLNHESMRYFKSHYQTVNKIYINCHFSCLKTFESEKRFMLEPEMYSYVFVTLFAFYCVIVDIFVDVL